MKSPLLIKDAPRSKNPWSIFLKFVLSFVFTFFFFILIIPRVSRSFEEPVAALGIHLYALHFQMGHLPDTMKTRKHYRGRDTKALLPFEMHCSEDTPPCDNICDNIQNHIHQVVEGQLLEEQPFISESCVHSLEGGGSECWPTKDMRCWGLDPSVWDGIQEWTILSQDLSDSTPGLRWIHFRSQDSATHLFVFGAGTITSLRDVDQKFQQNDALQLRFTMVPENEVLILSGHSMGAGWATYINAYLGKRRRPPETRILVTTGTPLVGLKYHASFEQDLARTGRLLLAMEVDGKIVTDVEMVRESQDVSNSFPASLSQFAYACKEVDDGIQCIDPQPQIFSIDSSLVAFDASDPRVKVLHEFQNYQICFLACSPYFTSHDITFPPNVDNYMMRESSNIAEGSSYRERKALATSEQIKKMLNVVMVEFKPGADETLEDYKKRVGREVNSRIRRQGFSVNSNWLERKWFDDMSEVAFNNYEQFKDKPLNLLMEEQSKRNSEARDKKYSATAEQIKSMVNKVIFEFKPGRKETLEDYKQRVVKEVDSRIRAQGSKVNTNYLERNWFADMTEVAFNNYDQLSEKSLDLLIQENSKTTSETKAPKMKIVYASAENVRNKSIVVLEDTKPKTGESLEEYSERVVKEIRRRVKEEGMRDSGRWYERNWFVEAVQKVYLQGRLLPPAEDVTTTSSPHLRQR